ncbi:MAG: class I SAM-dependent methyltransferase [Parcubacteria group bacterium]|nr:class I SAM-dependent methyltransferase [Parcubacteria group bacterium]
MINYFAFDYEDKNRWMSYWHQIKEISNFHSESVLIIGKGSGLVSEYLKLSGIKTTTLDIDESLSPDVVASVLDMPFKDSEFDAVLCAQVLEHLPYEDFTKAIFEIKRVANKSAVISLPHFGPAIRFLFKFPFFPEIKFMVKLPYPKKHLFKGEHYWEIGKRGYSAQKIKKDIEKCGFNGIKDYIFFENPLHHFFVLKK